ncbi:RNA polymerase sigma factor [Methylosinus sp. Ce-a6]|uniref:RNA polymerase sigma factor n=1 Tax=Methylosinus sp. Ce-a6 TaxID=2172005 RepID=UPI0013591061|nr:sigma-70 family RNA polymerase sigma factor [Methylosinus sp. Ce-a6]
MTVETSRATLINLLLAGYDDLKKRLARRLGSSDIAADILHDTFVRLNSDVKIGPVTSPEAYLFRIAMRIAADRRRAESWDSVESRLFFDIADDTPDPERIVEARSDIEALKRGLMEMPQRRRDILIAASIEEVPYSVLAERFNVTRRTIQNELRLALVHCSKLLNRAPATRMPPRRRRKSEAGQNEDADGDLA